MNDLFDLLNSSNPRQGLKLDNESFVKLTKYIQWLDNWERTASPDNFLTNSTAQGLRVTLHSVLGITKYLINFCSFIYVLTDKLNQDPLEVNS
jgi:hypothetical protein